jgi:glycosyltransferase involved in cell wall biosynthesis
MRCRWTLLQNGIDVEAFRVGTATAAAKSVLGLDPARPVVGTVGRLESRKGHDVLLAAIDRLRGRRPPPQLVVVGEGPAGEDLRRQVRALGLGADVRFTGTLEDVRPVLAATDVFALPSREEGMSNALMEAMAASRPVVATDVGGNGEVLDHGRLGLLVPPDDAMALGDAIGSLLDDPSRAAAFAGAAHDVVSSRWGAQRMVTDLEQFYAERLAARGRRAA